MKYRLKAIDAMQYTGDVSALFDYLGEGFHLVAKDDRSVVIGTATYSFTVMVGAYVQKMDKGALVHGQHTFEAAHEPIN